MTILSSELPLPLEIYLEVLIPVTNFDIFEGVMNLDTFDYLKLSYVFGQGTDLDCSSKLNLLGI